MSDIALFLNPVFGTSRNVLALIRNCGVESAVVEYRKSSPPRARRIERLAAIGIGVRDLLRRHATPARH